MYSSSQKAVTSIGLDTKWGNDSQRRSLTFRITDIEIHHVLRATESWPRVTFNFLLNGLSSNDTQTTSDGLCVRSGGAELCPLKVQLRVGHKTGNEFINYLQNRLKTKETLRLVQLQLPLIKLPLDTQKSDVLQGGMKQYGRGVISVHEFIKYICIFISNVFRVG